MNIKCVKEVTSTRSVLLWAQGHIAKERKLNGKDPETLGMAIGKNYFTSRPVGTITAHGYAKKLTNALAMARSLKGNEAVLAFLRLHCRERKLKKQKTYGIRFVMHLAPEKLVKLALQPVDIDRLLVRSIEDTFAVLEEIWHPGDALGYILGIDHHAIGKLPVQQAHPHVRVGFFLLPQTENGVRVSLKPQSRLGGDGHFQDLVEAICQTVKVMVSKYLFRQADVTPKPTADWIALVKECARHALEDAKAANFEDRARTRKFILDKFSYYLTTSNRENIRRRYTRRMEELLKPSSKPLDVRWTKLSRLLDNTPPGFVKPLNDHTAPLEEEARRWIAGRDHEVTIWAFSSSKAIIVRKPSGRIANRSDRIREMFEEMDTKPHAMRVNMVGELAHQELEFCSIGGGIPGWIETLGQLAASEEPMPNQDIYRSKH